MRRIRERSMSERRKGGEEGKDVEGEEWRRGKERRREKRRGEVGGGGRRKEGGRGRGSERGDA